jgi:3-hydroxyisobutyrate dehydrogenase-like beta-hydroxyacid dehydrogenase
MTPSIAIVAPGNMGTGIASVLTTHGVPVRTCLAGRSPASVQRAQGAGMQDVQLPELVAVDFLLSIMPPAAALPFARQLAPLLAASPRKPVFVDCNAKSPQTAREIGAVIEATGTPFVDAAIIGLPPGPGREVPRLYAAGEPAAALALLRQHGLDVRVLAGKAGAAAALKMSFAGINKGLTAVASAMILAAQRAGAGAALHAELLERWPQLMGLLSRQVPDMLPKAYRWVEEMRQIAEFAGDDPATREIFLGAARLYERIAQDRAGMQEESEALADFFPARS